ncbi:GNAT family N-acetyltransferase [Mesorhizobium sp. YIM 152430]|uniref:GNAT family N-acetyltransferase n=1 Tax=Mesorhizobium sp. YIM 152430 TaxID=3031761 RepID=UPI0023DACF3E|nr:GNAT family N-acetyltransferase [Mesorhizobium sp. YIM 152430]MDF1601504.1 GNAT family N-acetyltransferase [Mesorhizobium sp. YIM 152430]
MFVRTASKRDLKAVQSLLAETWHATYDAIYGEARVDEIIAEWHSMAALEKRLEAPLSEFLVADDGTAVGGVAYATAVDEGKTVMLHQLYVRPESQGRGIGGLLLDEIEGCFPDADKIRLEVEEANAKAVAFYLAQGFAKVGRTASCGRPDSGIPADIYERPIMWAE